MAPSDSPAIDLGSFYARRPVAGRTYRYFGYAACGLAVWYRDDPRALAILLGLLVLGWVMAWYREIGALWRAPLVAAMVCCAASLTLHRLHLITAAGARP
jgi:hypothetical protein